MSVPVQGDLQLGGFIHSNIQRHLFAFIGDGEGVWVKYDFIHLGTADCHAVADHEVFVHIHAELNAECGIAVFFDFRAGIFFAGTLVDGDQRSTRQFRGQRSIVGRFHRGITIGDLICQGKGTHINDAIGGRHHLHVFQHDTLITQRGIIKSGGGTADLCGEITMAVRCNRHYRFVSGNFCGQGQIYHIHRGIGVAIHHDPSRYGQRLSGNKHEFRALTQYRYLVPILAAGAVGFPHLVAEGNDRKYGGVLRDQPALVMDIGGAFGKEIALAVFPADGKGILGQDGIVAVFILCLDRNGGCFRGKSRDGLRGAAIRTVRPYFVRLRCARVFFVLPFVRLKKFFPAVITVAAVILFVFIIEVGCFVSLGRGHKDLTYVIAGCAVHLIDGIHIASSTPKRCKIHRQSMRCGLGCGAVFIHAGAGVGVFVIGDKCTQFVTAVGNIRIVQRRCIFIRNTFVVFHDLLCRHRVLIDVEHGKRSPIIEPHHIGPIFLRGFQTESTAQNIDILLSCYRNAHGLQLIIHIAAQVVKNPFAHGFNGGGQGYVVKPVAHIERTAVDTLDALVKDQFVKHGAGGKSTGANLFNRAGDLHALETGAVKLGGQAIAAITFGI